MRKIIHVDMDCFYAAVEVRDEPKLKGQPVAVGGSAFERGVVCAANYEARKYGVHSAMPVSKAVKLCPDLQVTPVHMQKYRDCSKEIHNIFKEYTDIIEPLSLDEAYLDVTTCNKHHNSATWIAQHIRDDIEKKLHLTASAGISVNKFLAKVASRLDKPNGQFTIAPDEVKNFMYALPIGALPGVGQVTEQKLQQLRIHQCGQLQACPESSLIKHFGKFGLRLHQLARGIDEQSVIAHRVRKALSVEHTFSNDLKTQQDCLNALPKIFNELQERLHRHSDRVIKNQFIKIKFNDFQQITRAQVSHQAELSVFLQLFEQGYLSQANPVRLLGLGVHFSDTNQQQLSFLKAMD